MNASIYTIYNAQKKDRERKKESQRAG